MTHVIHVFLQCIVQSYLQWLQDSDWNPICTLCSENLRDGDCIRLICYHVYHWACLDKYAKNLPATTAPAGYTCPSCQSRIFPQVNLVSPVADVLREKLAGVNWARAGLGLPLVSIFENFPQFLRFRIKIAAFRGKSNVKNESSFFKLKSRYSSSQLLILVKIHKNILQ